VQKAAAAGIGIVAAVGAPSSLAVQAAESFGMTVLGFVRNNRYNIYSHGWRLQA
jgi:FdhD protein